MLIVWKLEWSPLPIANTSRNSAPSGVLITVSSNDPGPKLHREGIPNSNKFEALTQKDEENSESNEVQTEGSLEERKVKEVVLTTPKQVIKLIGTTKKNNIRSSSSKKAKKSH